MYNLWVTLNSLELNASAKRRTTVIPHHSNLHLLCSCPNLKAIDQEGQNMSHGGGMRDEKQKFECESLVEMSF